MINSEEKCLEIECFENSLTKLEISQTIVAFSNTNGGIIYIGKNKKGKTIGIIPSEEKLNLLDIFENLVSGAIKYELYERLERHKYFIEIIVHKSIDHDALCIHPEENSKVSYIRIDNKNQKTSLIQLGVWKNKSKIQLNMIDMNLDEREIYIIVKENSPISITQILKKSKFEIHKTENILVRLISSNLLVLRTKTEGSFLETL